MKLKNLFFTFVSMAMIFFSACNSDDTVTGVSLDQASLSVAAKDSAELVATVQPKGAKGDITWTSSNTSVATVVNGKVKGVAIGTANIIASVGTFTATCVVTVTKEVIDVKKSLSGTEYYILIMDGVTATKLGTKIKADLRPDQLKKNLFIWDATFNAGTTSGPNFYGEVEPWTSLIVTNVGWSGGGFNIDDNTLTDKLADITANPTDYYLHIGIRSKGLAVYVFGLDAQSNAKFAIGANAFNDNGKIIPTIGDFTRDGEWQEIEIPMSTLKTMGLLYSTSMGAKNILWFLAGGISGTTLDLDAVFIYKK